MILQSKEMYLRIIKVLRLEHSQCKTDLEALEREKAITVLWKERFEEYNKDVTDQVAWIAAIDTIIEAAKETEGSLVNG